MNKFLCLLLCFLVCIHSVLSETQWVWSKNPTPHISGSSSNFGQSNNNNNAFQQSQISSSLSGSNINNNLPAGTIRIVNSNGEARLIPGAANFLSNALSNLGGGGGSAGGDGGGGGGSGLLSIGSGLVSSLFQNGPQIVSSALSSLFGGNRNPVSNSNNNSPSTLPASIPPFPILGGGGGGGSSSNSPSSSSSSQDCQCVPLNQCFLPRRPNGDCAGGNSNCCLTSTRTGAVTVEDFVGGNTKNVADNPVRSPTDIRVGLLENIVRGSSTVFDDALDLVLQPWLTQEDQQRLANRIAKNG